MFRRQNQSFHNGDASFLAHRAEARLDAPAATPCFVLRTRPELAAFVADEVTRCRSRFPDCSAEKGPHFDRRRLVPEDCEAHGASRTVIRGGFVVIAATKVFAARPLDYTVTATPATSLGRSVAAQNSLDQGSEGYDYTSRCPRRDDTGRAGNLEEEEGDPT